MVRGKTETGFAFKLEDEARDDMELLEMLTAMGKGDLTVMPDVLVSLLGADQKKKLYDHCRGKSGRVSSKRVAEELEGIFKCLGEKDNEVKN